MEEIEYDVAFSFHQQDEGLAQQLNDLLSDRFKTFIYSERQVDLAGKDGEVAFGSVYAEKARVVVVLCRKEWGQTPFTRIEETAIRGRAYKAGYDFSLFIPTDEPAFVPPWLPKTQLWYGLKRFGLDTAAGVIEHMIQSRGGETRIESIDDRAARLIRSRALKKKQDTFLHSDEGVKAAWSGYREMIAAFKADVERLKAKLGLPLAVIENENEGAIVVHGLEGCVYVHFRTQYTNVLEGHPVVAEYLDGTPKVYWLRTFDEPRTWAKDKYQFALLGEGREGFYDTSSPSREFTAEELAAHVLRRYMDVSEKHAKRREY